MLLLLLLSVSASTNAENADGLVVVSHIDSPLQALSKQQIKSLFLGKRQEIHGLSLQAVDIEQWQGTKQAFYEQVIDKNASQLNAYWARKLFTGRGKPPHRVKDAKAFYYYLRRNKNAVAYMSVDDVDLERVKILYR